MGRDRGGDNLHWYGEGKGAFCHACGYTIPSDDHKEAKGLDNEEEEEEVVTKEKITDEENEQLKSYTNTNGKNWRGIRKDTNNFFGVRYQYDEETGEPVKQFVPTTIDGKLVGYKTRTFPKDFKGPIGIVGKDCDLVGQFRFHNPHTVLIVGGEVDQLSAFQMLRDDQQRRGKDNFEPIAVVSPTVGENGCAKQIAGQYEWFNKATKIVLMMDNDETGQQANEDLAEVLPKDKVYIARMRAGMKDPNDYLTKGKETEFVRDFWAAKPKDLAGVKTAAEAFDDIPDELNRERIPLPPYMHKMQAMMGGGIRQGRILNIIADTSIGKTTHVRRMVYHWIFNSPETPTVVSLEDTAAQYMLDLISVHVEINMSWNHTEDEIKEWLLTDEGQRAKHELCFKPDGSPRFYLIDERGGSIKHIEGQMEVMYTKYNSRLFVIDVLTDLLRGSNAEYAEDHMNFQKGFIKDGATIVNVHHTRKPPQDKEGKVRKVNEYDVLGTGSFVQSGAYNVVLNRDKLAEDPLEKNRTDVDLPKCRGGMTGSAGGWYYDFIRAKCHDFDDWVAANGPKEY